MNHDGKENGKTRLRSGVTSGSCAAAAARAAAELLFSGKAPHQVRLLTPSGRTLLLKTEVSEDSREGTASCFVIKDSGDDPDVTNGIAVCADLSWSHGKGIAIDGGEGIGRVTKPGLDQPPGAAAINSTPRRMIREQVEECAGRYGIDLDQNGVDVLIRIPGGEKLAEKTFNRKLGIIGGLSVLGTSGIVEPMSEDALRETIRAELRVKKAEGCSACAVAPGNYGLTFLKETYGLRPDCVVMSSNYIRDTLVMARDEGFREILLAGHIGKLVKVAGGVPNTHSAYGDRRMEILSGIASGCVETGGSGAVPDFSGCAVTDDAVRLMKDARIDGQVMTETVRRIREVCGNWTGGTVRIEVVMFSNRYGILAQTEGAGELIRHILAEEGGI